MASASANAINASSSKWLPKLKDKAEQMYGKGKPFVINSIGDTRWNSAQACFASLLRIKSACSSFANEKQEAPSFPKAVKDAWTSETFWFNLAEAELLIQPFCDCSFLMQREHNNTLAHVVLVFMNLYKHLGEYSSSSKMAAELRAGIVARWKREEHPLFFFGLLLHPEFASIAREILKKSFAARKGWHKHRNPLVVARLVSAAGFYYGKHRLFVSMPNDEQGRCHEVSNLESDIQEWISMPQKMALALAR